MPESALTAPKEKKLTGRQWFESGRAAAVCHSYLTLSPSHIVDALNLYCPPAPFSHIVDGIYILHNLESVALLKKSYGTPFKNLA